MSPQELTKYFHITQWRLPKENKVYVVGMEEIPKSQELNRILVDFEGKIEVLTETLKITNFWHRSSTER